MRSLQAFPLLTLGCVATYILAMHDDRQTARGYRFARPGSVLAACAVAVAVGLAGCAPWNSKGAPPTTAPAGLPVAQVPDSASIFDVIFLPIPVEPASAQDPQLPWADLDDSIIPPEVRRRLAANGLQAGRIATLDEHQIDQINEEDDATRLLREANVASEFERRRRRLSCREGQPYTLVVRRPTENEVSTMIRTSDGVVGRSLENPQFTLQLRAQTLDDGRVAVRLVPEIQHGQMKQNFVTSDSLAFRFDFSRPAWTLDELAIDVPLGDDQAVVVLPTEEPFGLGKQMFVGQRADKTIERTAVIVRLRRRPVHRIGN